MEEIFSEIGSSALIGGKVLIVVFMVLYLVFAVIVVRQVNLMTKTLQIGLESTLKVFAFLHLFFALGVLFISIMFL